MKKILLIGAGQIGSRHLQALALVKEALDITVIEPVEESLKVAQRRFKEVDGHLRHNVTYLYTIPKNIDKIDIAIIATTSKDRRKAIENILKQAHVGYFILEKLLFQNKKDYKDVAEMFKRSRSLAWVNCMTRSVPFYQKIKSEIDGKSLIYIVNQFETTISTSAVHYLDHLSYLTGCYDFEVNTSLINPKPLPSKREGFFELTGTLQTRFKDGSIFIFSCYPEAKIPAEVVIYDKSARYIIDEERQIAWVAFKKDGWKRRKINAPIPLQSQRTNLVVEEIIKTGKCSLTPYTKAVHTHLQLLDPLLAFFNKNRHKKLNYYPFT